MIHSHTILWSRPISKGQESTRHRGRVCPSSATDNHNIESPQTKLRQPAVPLRGIVSTKWPCFCRGCARGVLVRVNHPTHLPMLSGHMYGVQCGVCIHIVMPGVPPSAVYLEKSRGLMGVCARRVLYIHMDSVEYHCLDVIPGVRACTYSAHGKFLA